MKTASVRIIAGVDPTGYAGIVADRRTLTHLGLVTDLISDPTAIKIGMIENPDEVKIFLSNNSCKIVLDPLFFSSTGSPLFKTNVEQHTHYLKSLLPLVDIITPNCHEAEILLNRSITSYHDLENAAQSLIELGARNVLLKGGHFKDSVFSQDYWTNGHESFWLANTRFQEKNYRGTGCMMSSAIAGCLALGFTIKDAVVIGKMIVHRGIRLSKSLDPHTAELFYGSWPEEQVDLPYLSPTPLTEPPKRFQPCSMGLYPVVDRYRWLEILLPLGVKHIQLRIKDLKGIALDHDIQKSIQLAKDYGALLFINDYWEQALRFKAEGIHLGQSDIESADINRIREAGVSLGISTHCYYEVARAHTCRPSYMACGPIYPTTSKIMPFQPQGISQLNRLRRTLQYPLVAIGGINHERLPDILESGVEGVAVISAITQSEDPIVSTKVFLKMINESRYVQSL